MFRYLAIPAAILFFASCQEKGPEIDFTPDPVVDTSSPYRAFDTSYVASMPDTQQRRVVLVEEFTGVTCPNCPDAHAVLKKILESNPGQVASIGIQPKGNIQALPYNHDGVKTRNDNRTDAGTSIGSTIYGGVQALPTAGIDRTAGSGKLSALMTRADWSNAVTTRKDVPTKVNVGIETEYVAEKRIAVIKVRVAYTGDVNMRQRLTVALTENNVVDVQELATSKKYDSVYNHQHVLRDVLTLAAGSDILKGAADVKTGQIYERTFVYNVPAAWNADNCYIVAYVTNNDPTSQDVMQAAEEKLK